jgi:opacity protein-like surface antigen
MAMASPEDWDWNFNGVFGRRYVGDKDWEPFHIYDDIGVEGSWGKADEPLMFATDFFASQDSIREGNATLHSNNLQLQVGLRKIWTFGKRWNPYGGAGLTLTDANAERLVSREVERDSDDSYGLWLGGGLFYRVGENFNVGIAVRACLMNNYRLFGNDVGGNSTHVGFVIGWGAERGGEK